VQFIFQCSPVEVLPNAQGRVGGLRLARTTASEPTPQAGISTLPGTEFDLSADWIIPALGFEPLPCPATGDFEPLEHNAWGGLQVDHTQMTSRAGVFAAGDIVRGPTVLLETVRDARRAAENIHSYLAGNPNRK
jgi:glutamate synthase (NADPH) small chain